MAFKDLDEGRQAGNIARLLGMIQDASEHEHRGGVLEVLLVDLQWWKVQRDAVMHLPVTRCYKHRESIVQL